MGRGGTINRECPCMVLKVRLGRQRLQSPFYKYVQRIKGKYNKESKNLNNEVETMKTLKINPKVENILKMKEITRWAQQ